MKKEELVSVPCRGSISFYHQLMLVIVNFIWFPSPAGVL